MADTNDQKGREFEIMAEVADLIDQLPKDKQKQVMAMLAARYGLQLKEPPATGRAGYRPGPRSKRSY